VAATLAGAFRDDPAWSWVFADHETREVGLRAVWSLLLAGAVDYGWVSMVPGAEAATLWIPAGRPELTDAESARIGPLFRELLGPEAGRAGALMERFATARPTEPEHYYLSLFGTRPDRRGHGIGMALLAADLARIDAEGTPPTSSRPILPTWRDTGRSGSWTTGRSSFPMAAPRSRRCGARPVDGTTRVTISR